MKKVKFWILAVISVLLMSAEAFFACLQVGDLFSTICYIADLWGVHRSVIWIGNFAIMMLVLSTAYYSYFIYETVYTDEKKYTAYVSRLLHDRSDRFWNCFCIPKHIAPLIASTGYAFLYGMIFYKAYTVLNWISYRGSVRWIRAFYWIEGDIFFGHLEKLLTFVLVVACIFYWFYKEFKKQQKPHDTTEQTKSPTTRTRMWLVLGTYLLLLGIAFGVASWGADSYYRHLVQKRYPDEINGAHHMAIDVSMIQLIANPERYDGKLVRVIGVGNLEFENDSLWLSKEDYKYHTDNAIWIILGDRAIEYDDARCYNGEYVIVEGIFDKDCHGHMGAFRGTIKNINRYELWDAYKFTRYRELYTVTRNGDGTFSYQFVDQQGNVLYQRERETRHPEILQINANVAMLIQQTGTDRRTYDVVFYDFESGRGSDVFENYLCVRNGYVFCASCEGGTHRVIVQSIFDKSQYYQEYVLENCAANTKDASVSAYAVSNDKVRVLYFDADGEQKELFIQLPTAD